MNTYRTNAVIAGILFIVCTGATLLSYPFGGTYLTGTDYLARLAAHDTAVIFGAVIEFIWAASCAGIALALYPVLKRRNSALALGAVGFRFVEAVFVLTGTLSLLALLTLGREAAAGTVSYASAGTLLLAVRDWSQNVMLALPFTLGAFLYYLVLWSGNLVPRWLSGWGLGAIVLSFAATLIAAFTNGFDDSLHTYLNVPIGLNELVLAVWLIAKGFDRSAVAALPAGAGERGA